MTKKILWGFIFWLLLAFDIFLGVVIFVDIFEMWYGWGNDVPMGAEALGWMYDTKVNYALTAFFDSALLVSASACAFFKRRNWHSIIPLIVTPIFVVFLNYYLSGWF